MALHIYHNHRLEKLFDPAEAVLGAHSASPLDAETILVQSLGMGRYFVLEMAKRLGVFANYRIVFPNQFFFQLCETLCGERVFTDKQTSAWVLYDLLKNRQLRSMIPGMDDYDDAGRDSLNLYKFAESLADLFDQYTLYRPETVLAWDENKPQYIVNGFAHPLPEDSLWQMRLWLMLSQIQGNHRAALRRDLIGRIATAETIPLSRLLVFGVSTLPQFHLDILSALAGRIPVHLFLLNPCESSDWFNDVSENIIHRVSEELLYRKGNLNFEDHYLSPGNTLLTRNGREGADFFSLLLERAGDLAPGDCEGAGEVQSVLERLQLDIAQRRERSRADRGDDILAYTPGDASIRVAACYGPSRELEALHDEIIEAFEADPSLEPKDILVMVPDIEQYASYIKGVFDVRSYLDERIPYSIADLNICHDNEIASLFLSLCDMLLHGISYVSLRDFFSRDALRMRLDVDEADLNDFFNRMYDAGFRWGRDEDDHEEGGARFYQNSWHECARRLWAGVAYEQGDFVQESLIASAMNETMVPLAGRIMECTERIIFYSRICESLRGVGEWTELCRRMLDDFFPALSQYALQCEELALVFQRIEQNAVMLDSATHISFECYHYCVSEYLNNERRIFGFLDGKITFCELLPMRSVPFKMICLLGMNNGTIPRESVRSSFDLMKSAVFQRDKASASSDAGAKKGGVIANRQKGDRDRRDDDRYLFLETLMSARSRLYISYNAKSSGGDRDIPPSLLVSELLDYLDLCVDFGSDAKSGQAIKAQEALVVTHMLQPFAAAYFKKNSQRCSYDKGMYRAACAFAGKADPPVMNDLRLPEIIRMNCGDVIAFFRDPQRYFVRNVLHATLSMPDDTFEQNEPFTIDYDTRRSLFQKIQNGDDASVLLRYFPHTGTIPPLNYGSWMLRQTHDSLRNFSESLVQPGDREMVDVSIDRTIDATRVIVEGSMPLFDGCHIAVHLNDSGYNMASVAAANILLSSCDAYRGALYQVPKNDSSVLTRINPVASSKIDGLIAAILNGHRHPLHFQHRLSMSFAKTYLKGKHRGDLDYALNCAINEMKNEYTAQPNVYFQHCFVHGFPFDEEFRCSALALFDSVWGDA